MLFSKALFQEIIKLLKESSKSFKNSLNSSTPKKQNWNLLGFLSFIFSLTCGEFSLKCTLCIFPYIHQRKRIVMSYPIPVSSRRDAGAWRGGEGQQGAPPPPHNILAGYLTLSQRRKGRLCPPITIHLPPLNLYYFRHPYQELMIIIAAHKFRTCALLDSPFFSEYLLYCIQYTMG